MCLLWLDCFEHFRLGVYVLFFHEEEEKEVVSVMVGM
jgi:hypothetical protein